MEASSSLTPCRSGTFLGMRTESLFCAPLFGGRGIRGQICVYFLSFGCQDVDHPGRQVGFTHPVDSFIRLAQRFANFDYLQARREVDVMVSLVGTQHVLCWLAAAKFGGHNANHISISRKLILGKVPR